MLPSIENMRTLKLQILKHTNWLGCACDTCALITRLEQRSSARKHFHGRNQETGQSGHNLVSIWSTLSIRQVIDYLYLCWNHIGIINGFINFVAKGLWILVRQCTKGTCRNGERFSASVCVHSFHCHCTILKVQMQCSITAQVSAFDLNYASLPLKIFKRFKLECFSHVNKHVKNYLTYFNCSHS